MTVSIVELPTALPYLGALAMMAQAGWSAAVFVPVLVLYNAILVLPPLLILVLARTSGAAARLEQWRDRLAAGARTTFLTLIAVVGFLLLADAVHHFAFAQLTPPRS